MRTLMNICELCLKFLQALSLQLYKIMKNNCFYLLMLIIISNLYLKIGCINWQAHGNFSESNLTLIQTEVNACKVKLMLGTMTDVSAAKYLSDTFNAAWEPAWNVAVAKLNLTSNSDMVVVGYAFKFHWIWLNDRQNFPYSFVIWKDYNCHTWINVNYNSLYYYFPNTTVQNFIAAEWNRLILLGGLEADPWNFANNLKNSLITQYTDLGFTVIATTAAQKWRIGYQICTTSFATDISGQNYTKGQFLIMMTRPFL